MALIQQQQVQGLVQAVADITTVSGIAVNGDTTLTSNLIGTGFELATRITSLSGDLVTTGSALDALIATNSGAVTATGSYFDNLIGNVTGNLATTGTILANAIATTGSVNFDRLTSSGSAISGNIVTTGSILMTSLLEVSGSLTGSQSSIDLVSGNLDYTSGKLDIVSGYLDYTSGKLDTATGNLSATGSGLAERLGENAGHSSNFGLPTGLDAQSYGESYNIPNYSCGTRQLQWLGDLQGSASSEIYLGGVLGEYALMPYKANWAVKMVGHAKSIEPGDQRASYHTGLFMFESGFITDQEQSVPYVQDMYINGSSGYLGSGVHYGITVGGVQAGGHPVRRLAVTGHNNYTGTVRFHVTAEVSELVSYPSGSVYLST
mgnify:CR=1 FL=1